MKHKELAEYLPKFSNAWQLLAILGLVTAACRLPYLSIQNEQMLTDNPTIFRISACYDENFDGICDTNDRPMPDLSFDIKYLNQKSEIMELDRPAISEKTGFIETVKTAPIRRLLEVKAKSTWQEDSTAECFKISMKEPITKIDSKGHEYDLIYGDLIAAPCANPEG